MMAEYPISFNDENIVRLGRGKTQTRRPVKPTVEGCTVGTYFDGTTRVVVNVQEDGDPWTDIPCPYGKPGDILWVRQTWYCDHCFVHDVARTFTGLVNGPPPNAEEVAIKEWQEMLFYKAEHNCTDWEAGCPCHDDDGNNVWQDPKSMPRWASQTDLLNTSVRIERLQSISDSDIEAEFFGEDDPHNIDGAHKQLCRDKGCDNPRECACGDYSMRELLAHSWDAIYSGDYSWVANPWVWVIGFKEK